MKIQISFLCKKKKIISVFNENTDQFYVLKKSNLHLMKISIFRVKKSNLKNSNMFYFLKNKKFL